jgi:hypothetical protein
MPSSSQANLGYAAAEAARAPHSRWRYDRIAPGDPPRGARAARAA